LTHLLRRGQRVCNSDTLAKKGTTILQCMARPMSFHIRENSRPQGSTNSKLTKEKQWTVAISDIPWPRIEAVAEFRLRTRETPRIEAIAEFRLRTDGLPGKTPSKIGSIQSRCNELKARTKENTLRHSRLGGETVDSGTLKLEQRRNSGQWHSQHTRLAPTGQESKPLLSLRLWPRIEAVAEFRLRGNGEDPPDSIQEEMEKTHLIRCSKEEMEKTHLIRCLAINPHALYVTYRRKSGEAPSQIRRGNGEDPPDLVSSSKDKDGKPKIYTGGNGEDPPDSVFIKRKWRRPT
uniref:MABP domain-containing protein n=1 Tax=Rodentolepis nana TaxID=102285 RepID=A0A0R3TN63_RODNA